MVSRDGLMWVRMILNLFFFLLFIGGGKWTLTGLGGVKLEDEGEGEGTSEGNRAKGCFWIEDRGGTW